MVEVRFEVCGGERWVTVKLHSKTLKTNLIFSTFRVPLLELQKTIKKVKLLVKLL